MLEISARQNTEPQRPRPFVAASQQEFRGYLPPQSPPQPEFIIPGQQTSRNQQPQPQQPQQQQSTSVADDQFFQTVPTTDEQPPPEDESPSTTSPGAPLPSGFSPQVPPNFSQGSSISSSSFTQQQQQQQQTTTTFPNNVEPSQFLATNPPLNTNSETLQSDLNNVVHPPHIHAMTVQCSKDMMTINVEFNRPYDGVIYSKVTLT